MTKKRVDHAAEARDVLSAISAVGRTTLDAGLHKQEVLAEAQVHAILAVAEQQRIANLIEYMRLVNATPQTAIDLTHPIATALGIDQ